MQNCEPLVPLGWAVIIVSALAIVVPILRGRSDALTFWNVLLVSGVNFIGIGCFEVVYGNFHWEELKWFQPSPHEVQIFIIGTILFYASLFVSYYVLSKPIQSFTGRFFNKWPPVSLTFTIALIAAAIVVSIGSIAASSVMFVGPLLGNISQKIIVFAVVFSFCQWYENKRQLPMLVLFVGVFAYCLMFGMVSFTGRRLLLSVAGAPLACIYWLRWRYYSRRRILAGMMIAGASIVLIAGFYSSFRHAKAIHGADAHRNFSTVFKAMTSSGLNDAVQAITKDSLHFFSQYTMHYSLLTIHLVENQEVPVEPLNTLKFIVSYPIPRAIWPGKPNALGGTIVTDVLRLPVSTNWGLGIVAHGYHEGGYSVIVLYAFLAVVVVRLMDGAMRRHPDNRFLIATFCAGAPHILGWTRGDTSTMTVEVLEAFAFVWLLGLVGRFFYGTEPANGHSPKFKPPYRQLSGSAYQPRR
jgi:hypothetical protein